jgi:hypothetical protein
MIRHMPRSKGRKTGRGSTSGKLGKKAPNLTVQWGPVTTYDAEGNVVSVEPPKPEPKPKRRRRR